ncbi:MAG: alpha/beta fold hydrolase [Pseudomonadota bacterium]
MQFADHESVFLLPGPAGDLEILTAPAKAVSPANDPVGVICHPHPLFGGTMNNKVVTTLARTFAEMGLPTVRFNFRGVGKSTGTFSEGVGEIEDLLAVVEGVKQVKPSASIWLAGFSFGAAVAAHVATRISLAQLVTVAPPVPRFNLLELPDITCPWLVVQGEDDDVVIPADVYAWVATRKPQPKLIKIPNAGHFFHGQLLVLREKIREAL